jgi:hypothetical protein
VVGKKGMECRGDNVGEREKRTLSSSIIYSHAHVVSLGSGALALLLIQIYPLYMCKCVDVLDEQRGEARKIAVGY